MENQNEIRDFYDLTAEETADEWYNNPMLLPTIQAFISHLPEKPRVLDLGCGPGHESKRLLEEGATVVGIDFSERCIDIARERCSGARFEVMDFRNLDERFGRFDGVFAAGSLIHLSETELLKVMERITKILHPGAKLAAIMVTGEGIDEARSNLTVKDRLLRRTLYRYSLPTLNTLSKQNGLVLVDNLFLDEILQGYGWYAALFQANPSP